jgi:hypothetical protein
MNVNLKLLNDDIEYLEKDILKSLPIKEDDIDILIENLYETDDIYLEGNDQYGDYIINKKLFAEEAYEIADRFGMFYAYNVYLNFSKIDPSKINRRLMYYIMEFTY